MARLSASSRNGLPPTSAYEPPIPAPDHTLRMRCGRVFPHRMILFRKIGPGVHRCHWCRCLVEWRGPFLQPEGFCWFVDGGRNYVDLDQTAEARSGAVELFTDHKDGNARNNDEENLVPSCPSCNSKRARAGNPLVFDPHSSDDASPVPRTTACKQCGDPVGYAGRGRRPSFCGQACRQRHYRVTKCGHPIERVSKTEIARENPDRLADPVTSKGEALTHDPTAKREPLSNPRDGNPQTSSVRAIGCRCR